MAAHVDVRVWIAHIIPMWGANFHIKNFNINMDISTSDVYNVHPQLHITPQLEAMEVDFDFFCITWLIKWFLKPTDILPMLEKAITSGIDSLNAAWRNPQKTSGLIGLVGKLLLSLEPVRPIDMDKKTDLIEFGLDGRVFDESINYYVTKDCEETAERIERTHSNQFFIHESTVEDIVKGVLASKFPFEVQTNALDELLGIFIPQLSQHYKAGTEYKFSFIADEHFRLHLNIENGIQITNTGIEITILAKEPKAKSFSEALKFSIHADFNSIDVHIQDLVVYTHIAPVTIKESFLLNSNIGDLARNNWDQFFEALFNMAISQINVKNSQYDIKKLDPQIEMAVGQIPNSTVSPFIYDGFLYGGLRFFND
jgi:hypothetical protein